MKKITKLLSLLFVLITTITPLNIQAQVNEDTLGYKILATLNQDSEQVFEVKDFRVIDGDTVDLILDRQQEPSIKARLLLIDTPEKGQPYAKEASARLNELLEEADVIRVEYEGPEKDKYQRDLVHLWVDDVLVQEVLVIEGYAIARYIHDYLPQSRHVNAIYESQDYAQRNNLLVWNDGNPEYTAKAEYASGQTAIQSENTSAQTETQEVATPPQAGQYVDENGNGLIKGSSSGIYHVPGSTYYDRTTNPAAWFKSIEEAENAGYRAPKR